MAFGKVPPRVTGTSRMTVSRFDSNSWLLFASPGLSSYVRFVPRADMGWASMNLVASVTPEVAARILRNRPDLCSEDKF